MAPAVPPAPRGFVIDRNDGRRQLPGSLHTNRRLSQWLGLGEPGVMLVRTGKVELGQGILTALRLLVAEELDLPLERVRVLGACTDAGPDEGVTSGSLSVQDSGGALRHACAELRGMALERAAQWAGASVDSLQVRDGAVHTADGRAIGDYWSLLTDADLDREYEGRWQPKPASQRRLLGRDDNARIDLADKVFGAPRFVQDLRLPGMLHGRVLRAPTLTATLAAWPPRGIDGWPAGVRCWADGRFVAVVAPTEREAEAVAERVRAKVEWLPGAPLPDASNLPAFLREAPHETVLTLQRGEPQWPAGGTQHRAEFFKPYLAHASIGPSCAIARWDGARLEVWTHSQSIHNLRDDIALAFSTGPVRIAKDAIVIRHVEGSGCYGHNGADDVAFDAVMMALACPGQPVRVQWTRADELSHSPFGAAHLVELQARLDESGTVTHWKHQGWSNGYSSRPGRSKTPTLLASAERAASMPLPLPINPPVPSGGGAERNAEPRYALPNVELLHHRLTVMPLRTSAMRALGAYVNVFAIESFMDELAQLRGEDPLAFRRRHLQDARALAVLDEVVARSTWWGRRAQEPEGTGHGLAWAKYKNSGAWCAALVRVQVAETVRVLDVDLAVDVGMVVDRDGVINQFEGGAIQSTSWALKEAVGFDAQGVTTTGWDTYPVLRFGEVPSVRVHVIDRPDEPPLGAGEAAQGPVVAAIGNAIHDALGVRMRSLPFTPERIARAIHEADT